MDYGQARSLYRRTTSVEIYCFFFFAYVFSRFSRKRPQQQQKKENESIKTHYTFNLNSTKMPYYNFTACVILCLQFVKFNSSASFKIMPRLEIFSGHEPAVRFKSGLFLAICCFALFTKKRAYARMKCESGTILHEYPLSKVETSPLVSRVDHSLPNNFTFIIRR